MLPCSQWLVSHQHSLIFTYTQYVSIPTVICLVNIFINQEYIWGTVSKMMMVMLSCLLLFMTVAMVIYYSLDWKNRKQPQQSHWWKKDSQKKPQHKHKAQCPWRRGALQHVLISMDFEFKLTLLCASLKAGQFKKTFENSNLIPLREPYCTNMFQGDLPPSF